MKCFQFLFISLSLVISSCHTSKKVVTEILNDKPIAETPIVGNDSDEHGCKNSAGYTWSILKNECVRIFEAGSSFISADKSQSLGAFVIVSSDKKQAELFLPKSKTSLLLQESTQINNLGEKVLFENSAEKLSITQGPNLFQIKENGESVFTQAYSSDYGLGKLFSVWAPETPIVGNDLDEHGCKASAGNTWSILKNNCVRIFGVGTSFETIDKNQSMSAFALLSNDSKQVELFLPNSKKSLILDAVKKVLDNSSSLIFENKSENIEIVQSATDFTIRINKKDVYQQKYSKEYGLGSKF